MVPRHRVDDGINAVRAILPRCWFDIERTEPGIECLRQYRTKVDDATGAVAGGPLHDQYSHGADAFRYLAMGIGDRFAPPPPRGEPSFGDHLRRHFAARRDARDGLI